MDKRKDYSAMSYLERIRRIAKIEDACMHQEDVLLLPQNIDLLIDIESNVHLPNYIKTKDFKAQDMIRIIEIDNVINAIYKETNIIVPSVYMHSLDSIPWHVTTQCFLISYISDDTKKWIQRENKRIRLYYNKHSMDEFWLPCSKNIYEVSNNEPICVFNRRISGWDGSVDMPVIELLGAGGHLQSIWNGRRFVSRTPKDNLRKEFKEEVGLDVAESSLNFVGGFINANTNELVMLFYACIDENEIPVMQKHALGNFSNDIDGLYLGTFSETINQYRKNPFFFAGGELALSTNFPSDDEIMERINSIFNFCI